MPEPDPYGEVTARYYDGAYAGLRDAADVDFYVQLARESGGPVLELGVGTGRVLLAIAALGNPCTGLDLSPRMLDALRSKPIPPTLRLVQGAMQDFDLGEDRFALICAPFRVFQHLYTVADQLACLARVREHLAPGGRLAFDVFKPRLASMAIESTEESVDARFRDGQDEVVRYSRVSGRDTLTQCMQVHMRYERSRAGEVIANERVEFTMRWFFQFELEHLLARAGFEIEHLYGDFERGPLEGDSPAYVIVARTTD